MIYVIIYHLISVGMKGKGFSIISINLSVAAREGGRKLTWIDRKDSGLVSESPIWLPVDRLRPDKSKNSHEIWKWKIIKGFDYFHDWLVSKGKNLIRLFISRLRTKYFKPDCPTKNSESSEYLSISQKQP